MAKEGIEVIQANNRRVAAAKKAAALTAKHLQAAKVALEAAQKAVEAAQKDHDEAAEELKDAEQSQTAAQKKWEVVDLVQDDEEQEKNCSDCKKRSDVSSDSEANEDKGLIIHNDRPKRGRKLVSDVVRPSQQRLSVEEGGTQAVIGYNASEKAKSDSNIPEEITVEGCGLAEANGTYKRNVDFGGAPQYFKQGQWKGEDLQVEIYRILSCWCIAARKPERGGYVHYRFYMNRIDSPVPPSDGWSVSEYGEYPPPKIL
eukprot:scaffold4911_cov47-Cyclotella_meneghiniana.AAC.8